VLYLVLLAMSIMAILGVPRFVAAWRKVDPNVSQMELAEETAENSDVLRLPADRGGPTSVEERDATSVARGGEH
jgi:hypothetical protein